MRIEKLLSGYSENSYIESQCFDNLLHLLGYLSSEELPEIQQEFRLI